MTSFREELLKIKHICESDDYKSQLENICRQLKSKKIVLYGAGTVGIDVYNTLNHYGIKVAYFCDKHKTGTKEGTGIPIITPQELATKHSDALIIISTFCYTSEIIKEIIATGLRYENILSQMFINDHYMTPTDIETYLPGYERAYNIFEDDTSKRIVIERLKCYLTPYPLIPLHLTSIPISPVELQYFDSDVISLSDDENFADGGMFTGDTALQFLGKTNGRFRHYYGFEPESNNYQAANNNLENMKNITTVEKGLWSSSKRLHFSSGVAGRSGVSDEGCSYIEVTSLDDYFSGKIPPTFIKMDIEGAETEALKGSERIICDNKPKLAICAYHKPEDIYELPELIHSMRDDYKFCLRHYTNSLNETVLYAV